MNYVINLTEAREWLLELVPQAGRMLRGYFVSRDFTLKQKEGVDFTTQADEKVDAFLRENISKKYPNTHLLTEETAPSNYLSLKNTQNLWIIDPLDGTMNFSRKNPHFAISVALVDSGKPKLGVVYVPMTQDMYWTQKDTNEAFLNGKRIHVSSTQELREVVVAVDWAYDLEKRKNVVRWLNNVVTHARQIKSMGSAVTDLASLANGRIDGYMNSGLKPWDVAASALLIEKAGGRISTPTGDSWNVFNPDMLATNGIIHEKILDLINKRSR